MHTIPPNGVEMYREIRLVFGMTMQGKVFGMIIYDCPSMA